MLKSIRRFRAAGLCALAVLFCELIARPFTAMSVGDDGPYIRMAQTFAKTGHIVYNGWAAAAMISQIYLAQPFIKLFGESYTTVRMTNLLVALVTTIAFHRLLVRTGAFERNATLGTLAVVLSPLYLMLSVTFMSDIQGMLAVVLCTYGCVRAIQASSDRSAIRWICFAVFTCTLFGTSRQIAWVGDLTMVPCTLWHLRSRTRVLITGAAFTAVAFLFIFGCLHWLGKQPYYVPVPFFVKGFPMAHALMEVTYTLLEIPFLILPVAAIFAPRMFGSRRWISVLLSAVLVAYVVIAFLTRKTADPLLHLEPTVGNAGSWINLFGLFSGLTTTPLFLPARILVVVTAVCLAGLFGIIVVAFQPGAARSSSATRELSWKQLGILLLPYSVGYLILLAAATGTTYHIYDRYALGLLAPAIIVLIRLYQERVRPNLPLATAPLIIIMAAYGMIVTHNTFAFDRARVRLADELHAHGVPYTSIDGGWDYNFDTELDHADHINNPLIKVPAGAYVPTPPPPPGYYPTTWYDKTPHVRAVYGISFLPDILYGTAPFAPVQYRSWPLRTPVTLYAVRYAPPNAVAGQEAAHVRGQKQDDQR